MPPRAATRSSCDALEPARSRRRAGTALLFAALAPLALAAPIARAATFTVTSADDSGAGTLRQAITMANASAAADTIVFDFTDATTITLASPLPDVEGMLTIDAGEQGITLEGPGADSLLVVADDGFALLRQLEISGNNFAVGSDAVLAVSRDTDDSTTIHVTGTGSFEKRGDAELDIAGANDYTGGTTVRTGALRGDVQSLQGDIDIRADAVLIFDLFSNGTYAGSLDGDGSLEKDGTAILTLTGDNQHQGGTRIRGGTLVATALTLQGKVRIDQGALFQLVQDTDGTYAGELTGSGGLAKSGSATLTLTGHNSYSGGTTVGAGMLQGDADSLQGDIEVAGGATVAFDQSGTGTYGGDLSGDGALMKTGSGTLVMTGRSTHMGGTAVSAGTLRGDTDALQGAIAVASGAVVAFDQSGSGTFDGQISGAGSLRKLGSGQLVIDQDQSYTGGTTVSEGALALRAASAGDLVLASGAALRGNWSLAGALIARGRVEPDDFATLSAGSASFESGSRLAVAVDDTGASSRVAVAGAAAIDGGRLEIAPVDGIYSGVTATVLSAGGGLSGPGFSDVTPDFPFLDAVLSMDANNVFVTLTTEVNDVAAFAQTGNQQAAAGALQEMIADGNSDAATVLGSLSSVMGGEVGDVLDRLSGDELSAFQTSRTADAERFTRSLSARFDALRLRARTRAEGESEAGADGFGALSGSPAAAWSSWDASALLSPGFAALSGPSTLGQQDGDRWGAFLDVYGLFGDLEGGSSGAKDVDYDVYGPLAGFDYALADSLVVGISAGYAHTALEAEGRTATGYGETAQGALYAAFVLPHFHLSAAGRYAWSSLETKRSISFGALSRRARGDFDAWDASGYLEAGYAFGDPDHFEVEPIAALLYTHGAQDAFREHGAGSLDLDVDQQDFDSLLGTLGARIRGNYRGGEVFRLLPYLRAAWEHEYLAPDRSVEARFTGAQSGGAFAVVGAEPPRDTALVGVGWDVGISDHSVFRVSYDARVNAEFVEHAVSLGLRVAF